jgi:hypothetical protein
MKTTTLYAVFREGAYRHECAGVFSTLEAAAACADALAEGDVDHHHSYDVVPFRLDEPAQVSASRHPGNSPTIHEEEWIYSIRRGEGPQQRMLPTAANG